MEIKHSKNLDVDYTRVNNGIVTESGVYFTFDEILHKDGEWLRATYAKRLNEPLYNYEEAKNGNLVLKYFAPASESVEYEEVELVKEEPVKVVKEYPYKIIGIALLLVGIGCIACSVYFTMEYLKDVLPVTLAVGLAVLIVIFSTASSELAVIFDKKIIKAAFSFITVVCLLFSMSNTLAVMYGGYQREEEQSLEEHYEANSARAKIEAIRKQEEIKEKEIEVLNKSLQSLYDNDVKLTDWRYGDYQYRITKAQRELQTLTEKETALIEATPDAVITTEKKKETFFDFVGKLFGISPALVQFVLSAFPACFVDVAAVLSVTSAFEMLRKEELCS